MKTRDRLGKYQKKGPADGGPTDEDKQCQLILDCMVAAKDGSASEEAKVYNEMNCLAEMTMERILDAYMGK